MRIGELSRTARVSIQTLRFYERKKLLREPPRTSGGYRFYSESDLTRVRFIRDAQDLGFTLKEICVLVKIHETASASSNPRAAGHTGRQEAFRRRLASGPDGSSRTQFQVCPASRPPKPSRKRPASTLVAR